MMRFTQEKMHRSPRELLAVVAVLALLLAPSPVRAAPILTVPTVGVLPGGGGFFDVTIAVPAGDPTVNLAGFTVTVAVPPGSGITFTNLDFPTPESFYVFDGPGGSTDKAFSIPLATTSFPDTTATGVDLALVGSVALGAGETFGLARVFFEADAGLPLGTIVPVQLVTASGLTSLSDENGDPIPFVVVPGQIEVVPEPATGWLLLVALGGLAGWRRRRGSPAA